MAKILHHNDDDGRCAASIAMNELIPIFAKDMIFTFEYNYNHIDWTEFIDTERFINNDIAIIVDLSMCDSVYDLIKMFTDHNVPIIYIDHHKATQEYLDTMSDEQKEVFNKVTSFYKIDVSASMLTWIYSCMNDDEKKHPNDVKYDFSASFSHVMINPENARLAREYRIPPAVFYIDDYDIWRHSTKDTLAFHYGFASVIDKNPKLDKLWSDIIYGMGRQIQKYIEKGRAIVDYKTNEYEYILKRGHAIQIEFEGRMCNIFTVNNPIDSFMFETIKPEYDACVAYWYNGASDQWHYSVRSGDNGIDCDRFINYLTGTGGGHYHASGCVTKEFIQELA